MANKMMLPQGQEIVEFTKYFGVYNKGEIANFTAERAKAIVDLGAGVIVNVKKKGGAKPATSPAAPTEAQIGGDEMEITE